MSISRDEVQQTIALSLVPDLGPKTYQKLIRAFGSAGNVLKASLSELKRVEGVSVAVAEALGDPTLRDKALEEMALAQREEVDMITVFDQRYPAELKQIYAPPILIYVKGALPKPQAAKFAIVGSRGASLYGRRIAVQISKELAEEGIIIVSGMAMGIDCSAHEGALSAGRATGAVLGSGLSRVSPGAPQKMADRIVEKGGALISEYPMQMHALPKHFPVRNRIISGLSYGVLVVEARSKSGALITADAALEQGREVYAVPGNADSSLSQGTNRLLKQGAKLTTSAEDILQDLSSIFIKNPKETARRSNSKTALSDDENAVLSVLESEPLHVDELIACANLPVKNAITALSFLELKGYAKQLPGKNYVAIK